MALARDVADDFEAVGEAHLRNLAQRRVRLLGRRRINARAHAPLLRRLLQRRHRIACPYLLSRLADQLIDRRHRFAFILHCPAVTAGQGLPERAKRKSAIRVPVRKGAFPFPEDHAALSAARSSLSSDSRQRQRLSFIHRGLGQPCHRQKRFKDLNDLTGTAAVPTRRSSPPAEKSRTCIDGQPPSQGKVKAWPSK